ncbi:MAG: TIGR01440 family protein [Clostridia bacterium]|nr:TIGR01440 family protein [Clostridia bacterium]
MDIREQCTQAIKELCDVAKLKAGDILVIGCSTSEVLGDKIGTNGSEDIAEQIYDAITYVLVQKRIYPAFQCCEHLNRAIVIERECMPSYCEEVNVVPQRNAGGSLATYAYNCFSDPVVVEEIKADAGIDIGSTLIGMHLKKVAVPVRLSISKIGEANIVCARTRPKFIGGVRAKYNENLF